MPNDNGHALLSASSASRWLVCTAAPRYEEQFPDSTSAYAAHGTIVHKMCELKVNKRFSASLTQRQFTDKLRKLKKEEQDFVEGHNEKNPDSKLVIDGDRYSEMYVEYVAEKMMGYDNPPLVNSEIRVDFAEYVPDGFGTCDCVIIGGDKLDIIDYKHGVGVTVNARSNPQMRLYALGALAKYEPFYGGMIRRVCMTVFQPRAMYESDRITSETLSIEELKAWGEGVKPVAQLAFSGFGVFVPGEHCRFCRGRAQCRARADANTALEDFKDCLLPTPKNTAPAPPMKANGESTAPAPPMKANGENTAPAPSILTNGEIGDLLERGKHLLAWYKDMEEYALNAILSGDDVPGWKAVEGRSNRAFTDHDAAAAAVIASGYDDALVYKRQPLPLTALESLMGKKDFAEKIGEFVCKPPGKPSLAPISDKRDPYSRAAADFRI